MCGDQPFSQHFSFGVLVKIGIYWYLSQFLQFENDIQYHYTCI